MTHLRDLGANFKDGGEQLNADTLLVAVGVVIHGKSRGLMTSGFWTESFVELFKHNTPKKWEVNICKLFHQI